MNYKAAYLHLFNRITDIIKLLENINPEKERMNSLLLLKCIQAEAEEVCISEKRVHQIIEQVALQEGISRQDFERSLQTIIDDGMANKNPEVLAHWRAIPCKGGKPTPVEFMLYLVRNLEK